MSANASPPGPAPAKPRTSGLAIASLILGIAGPCTIGLGSILGIILGIVGLVKIGKSAGQLGGRGLAIAGLVVSAVGVVLLPVILGVVIALLVTPVSRARGMSLEAASANNVRQLCVAAETYAAENKDQFPPADSWPEVLKDYGIAEGDLSDPAGPKGSRAYAINALVAGKKLSDVKRRDQTVLFFECAPGTPPAGGPSDLPPSPRHGRAYAIGFCDGHVEAVNKKHIDRLISLIWDPTEGKPNE
jgi:prepilin-type processing-associated H-X9-DG protein